MPRTEIAPIPYIENGATVYHKTPGVPGGGVRGPFRAVHHFTGIHLDGIYLKEIPGGAPLPKNIRGPYNNRGEAEDDNSRIYTA